MNEMELLTVLLIMDTVSVTGCGELRCTSISPFSYTSITVGSEEVSSVVFGTVKPSKPMKLGWWVPSLKRTATVG